MHKVSLVLLSVSFLMMSAHANGDGGTDCDAIELAFYEGQSRYKELACSGIKAMQEQKYAEAAGLFEDALAMPLFETPNFELLPRLAWAYFQAGHKQIADEVLLEAELALSVLTRLVLCIETTEEDGRYYLGRAGGGRLSGEVSERVLNRMCGAAYDYVYRPSSLGSVLLEAKLVNNYFDTKQRILEEEAR